MNQDRLEKLRKRKTELIEAINELINSHGLRRNRLAELTAALKETNALLIEARE